MTTTCTKCKEEKDNSEFHKSSRRPNGLTTWCKVCSSEYNKTRDHRATSLKRSFGITHEDYAAMMEKQGSVCAICGQDETTVRCGKVMHLSVDHDHFTGKVRGLLCNTCNRAIGMLGDSPQLLQKSIQYLKEHE